MFFYQDGLKKGQTHQIILNASYCKFPLRKKMVSAKIHRQPETVYRYSDQICTHGVLQEYPVPSSFGLQDLRNSMTIRVQNTKPKRPTFFCFGLFGSLGKARRPRKYRFQALAFELWSQSFGLGLWSLGFALVFGLWSQGDLFLWSMGLVLLVLQYSLHIEYRSGHSMYRCATQLLLMNHFSQFYSVPCEIQTILFQGPDHLLVVRRSSVVLNVRDEPIPIPQIESNCQNKQLQKPIKREIFLVKNRIFWSLGGLRGIESKKKTF